MGCFTRQSETLFCTVYLGYDLIDDLSLGGWESWDAEVTNIDKDL